jgi:hypothetical protein
MVDESHAPLEFRDRKVQRGFSRIAKWIVVTAIAFMLLGAWTLRKQCIPTKGPAIPLLALVAAPSGDDQKKLIAAFKAHPNPPLTTDSLPQLGSDAAGLEALFADMTKSETVDGVRRYSVRIATEPSGHDFDATYVVIEVAGVPPRIVKRRVEPSFTP